MAVRSHGTVSHECCIAPGDLNEARLHCPLCAYNNIIDAVNERER